MVLQKLFFDGIPIQSYVVIPSSQVKGSVESGFS